MTAAVRCQGIVQIYKARELEVVALRDVDLVVEEGETVALLGPSGAGKSTLLWLMAGLLRPSAGRLWLHGTEVSRLPQATLDRLRAAEIGVVLQNPARNLIPYATPAQNLAFAQRRPDRRRIGELLERVGLAGVRRPAGGLSGGEQQRLAVAVALANRPRLLLADEPTSQLDLASGRAVIELIRQTAAEYGTTVVAVTHDEAVSRALGRTVTIRDGRVGAEGRRGEDLVVVGREGALQLPPEYHHLLPPGSRVRVEAIEDGVALRRVEP
ncbi:ABC transporter ATP-binding protein [Thermopolyspora flexuosa]|uniref:ABC-type lipoprotein export system ATPase subunit n=1 Tax=Thermopolyspora flexuosa TaxID=103836 RepID=A0A543IXZ0_9ACTN|nr:ABC transporter ATP-binding protein [Thermopolyspora flexuosa]TQM75444.1 ABC-type lipoprotein export system ATPase subunit [Thermopolyspora flexuosa]GGM59413.1 ABC transporter ATP-binding protein [Thermopolyspora flexuosa]